jgi:hypothetical protein
MQEFYIRKGSLNPVLRMELFQDGRYDFKRSLIDNALQDAVVTFTMVDSETGLLKIAEAPADIVIAKPEGCEEKFLLQYKWTERDVRKEGIFNGWFEIKFNGNLTENGVEYPKGNLKVPIQDDLVIYIK